MLNIIDEFTGECLAIRVDRKLRSTDVIDLLPDLFILRGVPGHICSDHGPEFIARAVREWITAGGARTAYIEPGSPWENGCCESFNSKLRDELLDGEIFYSLSEARIGIEAGVGTTTQNAHIHRWAIARRLPRSCSGRLRHPDLLRRPPQPRRRGPSCTKIEPEPPECGMPSPWQPKMSALHTEFVRRLCSGEGKSRRIASWLTRPSHRVSRTKTVEAYHCARNTSAIDGQHWWRSIGARLSSPFLAALISLLVAFEDRREGSFKPSVPPAHAERIIAGIGHSRLPLSFAIRWESSLTTA
jgi:transposase InsO family protein